MLGDGAIGGEHELFNEAMSDVALAARDVGHALLFVKFDDWLGEIEVDGAVFVSAGVEEKGELLHVAGAGSERGVTLRHFRITFEYFVDVRIGHAFGRANDPGRNARGVHSAVGCAFYTLADGM